MTVFQLASRYETTNKQKGYERSYRILDGDGEVQWTFDVFGGCTGAPTEYIHVSESEMNFRMKAKGKILNATYFLENGQGIRFATITRKGFGFRWRILGEKKQEIARIIDPTSRKEAFFRELFSALPDSYAVLAEDRLIATIASEKLPEKTKQKPGNLLGKFLSGMMSPKGLTLRIQANQSPDFDPRALLAGLTLLQVHDITGVNRN